MTDEDIRRIVAVDAHRRRAGQCPTHIHALGSGDSSEIVPRPDGFVDTRTGVIVRCDPAWISLGVSHTIDIALDGDIAFSAIDRANHVRLSGRAGGGTSVTLYANEHYFQYAVVTPDQPLALPDAPPA